MTGREGLLSFAPSGTASALANRTHRGDRVFAPQTWTSFLEWAVPDARYLLDSRFELFSGAALEAYATVSRGGSNALIRLDQLGVTLVVTEPTSALADAVRRAGWTAEYEDAESALFVR
jgi:hypothetical protein